ncbi:hypothetical protein [Anabaena sp. UHCC 0451]|nr:hypothetical protein [Anabaena sp. UHCC 0451]MEA5574961.1 hypothetical protein [Anabaena sp. UHCC 0451]
MKVPKKNVKLTHLTADTTEKLPCLLDGGKRIYFLGVVLMVDNTWGIFGR